MYVRGPYIYLKSQRRQVPTDLESDIFTEFFLIPLSDLLIYVLQFAIETRGLNIIGGRNGYNPISEALRDPSNARNCHFKAYEGILKCFLS